MKAESNITAGFFEILKKDLRSPILWIRSFDDDKLEIDSDYGLAFEQRVVSQLSKFGPVMAIGDPQEKYPLIGAAREYFKNTDWLYAIDQLIQGSGIIVCVLGRTRGLQNEYNKIITAGKRDKLIVLIPPISDNDLQRRWQLFKRKFGFTTLSDNENILVNHKLLLFRLNTEGIKSAIYCNDKKSDSYLLAFNIVLNDEVMRLNELKIKAAIDKRELEQLIENYKILDNDDTVSQSSLEYSAEDLDEKIEKLNKLIPLCTNSFFKDKYRNQILTILSVLCSDKDKSIHLIIEYKRQYGGNLIAELISMNSALANIAENLAIFINFKIVDRKYPHNILLPPKDDRNQK